MSITNDTLQIKFRAFNPVNGQPLDEEFAEALESEVNEACEAAASSFVTYRKKSGEEKAIFFEAIADELLLLGDTLIERASLETGLPATRIQNERGRTIAQLLLFADLLREGSWVNAIIDTADSTRVPLPKPDVRQMQQPLGPVAVFGASNFPLAFSVAGGDTVSALAAGCPVIVKAHPAHPGTCKLVASAIRQAVSKARMPSGVFNMVHGITHQVGAWLVKHRAMKAVGFTGSYAGGKALFDLAAQRPDPIPVYAEMGSVNPVFFLPGALRDKCEELAKGLAASVTLGNGQFCTNPGMFVLVNTSAGMEFVQKLKEAVEAVNVGPLLTENIQKQYVKSIQRLAADPSINMLTRTDADIVQSHVFTTNTKAASNHDYITEEIFGPCTMGILVKDKLEMIEFAQSLKGQLTATLHSTKEDLEEYRELIEILQQKAGRLIINGFPTGVEVTHAMVHGGPFPATTDSRSTSVGTQAIYRFTRPVCFQDFPNELLPAELKQENPLNIFRKVNNNFVRDL
ncbi:aldehyde dehydrogenase (NADP(+)) [Lacibacter sp.]|uniref:aldehyde dehydrogenase (NADP(+)) n=1 Tax=Lacibacter sp. TaxID=1915409 RepID=UPI002B4B3DCC|nr:aldehyde dehydrogenase (NADP(+)) [Lacibacter sp.]HLP38202.1 aldehyde dehydrogenase (NADP(+)) [Lacibacter sp.]